MPLNIVRKDIAKARTDALVNPANHRFRKPKGGADYAIRQAAGPRLDRMLQAYGSCMPGQVVITPGFDMPAHYILHTVGPQWRGGFFHEEQVLAACYRNCLLQAQQLNCRSITFPLIASGSFGFPSKKAFEIAVREIRSFLQNSDMQVDLIVLDPSDAIADPKMLQNVADYISESQARALETRSAVSRRQHNEQPDLDFVNFFGSAAPAASDVLEEETGFSNEAELNQNTAPLFPSPAFGKPAKPQAAPRAHSVDTMSDEDVTQALEGIFSRKKRSFSETLLSLIDQKGMSDAQCYRKANVDRRLFSKIRSNPDYHPRKGTVIAFALALELTLEETRDLLARAGYALSPSSKFDLIVEFFISHGNTDVIAIDQILDYFGQPTLSTCAV